MIRVKLPKSFLAVNLSETHTFHKKEELDDSQQTHSTIAEMNAKIDDSGAEKNSTLSEGALKSV
jgi:inositol hexakisphosphate/diphosphoinositol-pentakisphosphate kinase